MTPDEAIQTLMVIMKGRTRYDNQEPFYDEVLLAEIERLRALIRELADGEECSFDHHGGCQTHGYLSLEPGQRCPMAIVNELAKSYDRDRKNDG